MSDWKFWSWISSMKCRIFFLVGKFCWSKEEGFESWVNLGSIINHMTVL